MSFRTVILKNTTGSNRAYGGTTIGASDQLDLSDGSLERFGETGLASLLTDIGNGTIVVNDGSSDLNATRGRSWLLHEFDPTGSVIIPSQAGLLPWDEVVRFRSSGATGDSYMGTDRGLASNQYPHFIALAAGRIVHVSETREKDPNKWAIIRPRRQNVSGTNVNAWNGGTWTNISTGLNMSSTLLGTSFNNLSGYTFSAGDAIAVYLDRAAAAGSGGSTEDPSVRLYIKYD